MDSDVRGAECQTGWRRRRRHQYSQCSGCKPAYRGMLLRPERRGQRTCTHHQRLMLFSRDIGFRWKIWMKKSSFIKVPLFQTAFLPAVLGVIGKYKVWRVHNPKLFGNDWKYFLVQKLSGRFWNIDDWRMSCGFIVLWWLYFAKKVTNITFVQLVQSQHRQIYSYNNLSIFKVILQCSEL